MTRSTTTPPTTPVRAPTALILLAACAACASFAISNAAATTAPAATAIATTASAPTSPPTPWRWVRTIRPDHAVPGTFGPAIAACNGHLVIGPARDTDLGDGAPTATVLAIRAGFGLPTVSAGTVDHPTRDRGAGFANALAAAERLLVCGSPHAGCSKAGCSSGQAHLVTLAHDGTRSIDELACPEPQPASEFGAAVATDGTTVAIGSPRFDGGAIDCGAVDIYEFEHTDAGPQAVHVARLVPPQPAMSARFGASIAIDGEWMAIGEPGAGPTLPRHGALHVARRVQGRWRMVDSLRTSAGANGWLGASVALAGGHLVAGAPIAIDPRTGARSGAVAHWTLARGAWSPGAAILAPALGSGSGFGQSVALGEGFLAIGAPSDGAAGEGAGSAWITSLDGGPLVRVQARTPAAGAGFGASLAFATAFGRTPVGPTRFLAVSFRNDPEQPLIPGSVELFGYRPPDPLLLAHDPSPQSRSASAIAIAADASVTAAGRQPESRARASATGP